MAEKFEGRATAAEALESARGVMQFQRLRSSNDNTADDDAQIVSEVKVAHDQHRARDLYSDVAE